MSVIQKLLIKFIYIIQILRVNCNNPSGVNGRRHLVNTLLREKEPLLGVVLNKGENVSSLKCPYDDQFNVQRVILPFAITWSYVAGGVFSLH